MLLEALKNAPQAPQPQPVAPQPPTPNLTEGGKLTLVLGDSIAVGAGPKLKTKTRAKIGIGTRQGIKPLRGATGNVLISLGANDDQNNPEAFRREIRRALLMAPGANLYWANIAGKQNLNRVLREESERSGGRLQVIDWTSKVKTSDGVHPADYGKYAATVKRAMR